MQSFEKSGKTVAAVTGLTVVAAAAPATAAAATVAAVASAATSASAVVAAATAAAGVAAAAPASLVAAADHYDGQCRQQWVLAIPPIGILKAVAVSLRVLQTISAAFVRDSRGP